MSMSLLRCWCLCALTASSIAARGETTRRYRVACVGDSITYGYLSSDVETRSYPAVLQRLLGDDWEVVRLGRNGARMQRAHVPGPQNQAWWDLEEYQLLTSQTWDAVIIQLGTNDARDKANFGPPNWPPDACAGDSLDSQSCPYGADYLDFISIVRELGSPQIFVSVPPPLMAPRIYLGMNITVINSVLPRVIPNIAKTAGEGVILVDSFSAMGGNLWPEGFPDQSQMGGCKIDTPEIAMCPLFCDEQSCDQCHPNDAGYHFIAEVMHSALAKHFGISNDDRRW